MFQSGVAYGLTLLPVAGSTTDLDVNFYQGGRINTSTYGAAGSAWPRNAADRWRVLKSTPSAPVGFGLASATETGLISTTTQPIAGVKTFSSNPVVSGGGVQFPATQVPSADANCLDDYEEGTWTPAIDTATAGTGRSTTITYATYTKVGRLVTFQCYITLGTLGSGGSGAVVVRGLPFTSGASLAACSWSYAYQLNAALVCTGSYINTGDTRIYLTGAAAAATNIIELDFTTYIKATTQFIISGSYIA